MKILITARKFKAHDTLKEFINDEVASLEKYNDSILQVEVVLSYLKNNDSIKTAELIVQVPGQTITATDETDDFKKSIVSAIEKVEKQLDKLKTKRTARAYDKD